MGNKTRVIRLTHLALAFVLLFPYFVGASKIAPMSVSADDVMIIPHYADEEEIPAPDNTWTVSGMDNVLNHTGNIEMSEDFAPNTQTDPADLLDNFSDNYIVYGNGEEETFRIRQFAIQDDEDPSLFMVVTNIRGNVEEPEKVTEEPTTSASEHDHSAMTSEEEPATIVDEPEEHHHSDTISEEQSATEQVPTIIGGTYRNKIGEHFTLVEPVLTEYFKDGSVDESKDTQASFVNGIISLSDLTLGLDEEVRITHVVRIDNEDAGAWHFVSDKDETYLQTQADSGQVPFAVPSAMIDQSTPNPAPPTDPVVVSGKELLLTNVNEEEEPIPNLEFEITKVEITEGEDRYKKDTDGKTFNGTSDEDGIVEFEDFTLTPNTNFLLEKTNQIDGYADTNPWLLQVEADGTVDMKEYPSDAKGSFDDLSPDDDDVFHAKIIHIFDDDDVFDLRVANYDSDFDEPLAGAMFGLTTITPKVLWDGKTPLDETLDICLISGDDGYLKSCEGKCGDCKKGCMEGVDMPNGAVLLERGKTYYLTKTISAPNYPKQEEIWEIVVPKKGEHEVKATLYDKDGKPLRDLDASKDSYHVYTPENSSEEEKVVENENKEDKDEDEAEQANLSGHTSSTAAFGSMKVSAAEIAPLATVIKRIEFKVFNGKYSLLKVDGDNLTVPLVATFDLFEYTGDKANLTGFASKKQIDNNFKLMPNGRFISGTDGKYFRELNMKAGSLYLLREVKAPDGFNLPDTVIFIYRDPKDPVGVASLRFAKDTKKANFTLLTSEQKPREYIRTPDFIDKNGNLVNGPKTSTRLTWANFRNAPEGYIPGGDEASGAEVESLDADIEAELPDAFAGQDQWEYGKDDTQGVAGDSLGSRGGVLPSTGERNLSLLLIGGAIICLVLHIRERRKDTQ